MSFSKRVFIIFLFFQSLSVLGQYNEEKSTLDSLNSIIDSPNSQDTLVVTAYYHLARIYVFTNPDTAKIFIEKAMLISEELDYVNGMGEAYGWMGYLNAEKGNIPEAIDYNLKSLMIAEKLGSEENYPVILNNLGMLHQDLLDHDQAIIYFNECAEINKRLGKNKSLATNYNNLGSAFRFKEDYTKSLEYYNLALGIRKEIDDQKGISFCFSNMGSVYELMGQEEKALNYYDKSIELRRQLKVKKGLSVSLYKSANIYQKRGEINKAKLLAIESNAIAKKYKYTYEIKESSKVLYLIYKAENQLKKALEYHEIYTILHDSLNSSDNQKAVISSKFRFEYNKKKLVDSLENQKLFIENELLNQDNQIHQSKIKMVSLWLVISVLGILLLIGFLIFINKTNKAKMEAIISETKLRLNETLAEQVEIEPELSKKALPDINLVLKDKLTNREQEILDLLAFGYSNREIGEQLFVSVNTIKTHILSLYNKLDVKNRTQAAIKGSLLKLKDESV